MDRKETVIVEGKRIGIIAALSIIALIWSAYKIWHRCYMWSFYNETLREYWDNPYIQSDFTQYKTENFYELAGYVVLFLLILIVLLSLGLARITVTDKRVYGSVAFAKRVDIPLDSISAIGTGLFNSVVVTSASGKLLFADLKNYKEIHAIVSDLLIKRQDNNDSTKNYLSADEILKYKQLLDEGIITQEEFDVKKKQLLGL